MITCTRRDGLAAITDRYRHIPHPPPATLLASGRPIRGRYLLFLSLHAPNRTCSCISRSVQGRPPTAADALLTVAILNIPIYTAAQRYHYVNHTCMIKTNPLPINTITKYIPIQRPSRPEPKAYGGMVAP